MSRLERILAIVGLFIILMTLFITLFFHEMKKLDVEMLKITSAEVAGVEKPKKSMW